MRKIITNHLSFIDEAIEASKETMEKFLAGRNETFKNINELRNKYFWERILMHSSSVILCKYLESYFKETGKLLNTL